MSNFSGAVLHVSSKGRLLEDAAAVFKMDDPSSQLTRTTDVLHDQMHIPLCLMFELERPFSKGHKLLI